MHITDSDFITFCGIWYATNAELIMKFHICAKIRFVFITHSIFHQIFVINIPVSEAKHVLGSYVEGDLKIS